MYRAFAEEAENLSQGSRVAEAHISEDGSLEAIDRFLQLVRPNCLAPSNVVPSEPGLESFSKKNQMRLGFSEAPSVSNLIRMDWRGGETPHPEFPPTDTGSLI